MAWDGNGTFTRTNGTQTGATLWASARDAGNNITASQHDTQDQDLATGIQACLTKNNESRPTATFAPNADAQYALGTSALRWTNIFLSGYVGDASGNELLKFSTTASAVNEVTIANAATDNAPAISATGGDTDVGLTLAAKGAGVITLGSGTNTITLAKATTFSSTITGGSASDIAINTNKFTVTAASGNTSVAGTLGVTGTTTLNSNLAVGATASGTTDTYIALDSNGGTTYGYLAVAGAAGSWTPGSAARDVVIRAQGQKIIFDVSSGGASVGMFNTSGYFKASSNGSYVGATGQYHELIKTTNTADVAVFISNNAATAANQYGIYISNSLDPNSTGTEFIQCVGNGTVRAAVRSNGGLANFSANDVNLSALSVKKDFEQLADVPGALDVMWEAHRDLDWARYRYKDQTHDEFNYGPSADKVYELFTKRGIPLTDDWQPEVERTYKGAAVIDGTEHAYEFSKREANVGGPLGITGDFQYVTGAMVAYAQRRIERIEAALAKAGISIN